ncbi:hypothetical protein, conserved [Eimeria tenella]|uniref:Uncharacterized protein n=1 Tax=Eimeria tenella TaxID=5802 RepID=U6L4Z4_EIMTE|nr:hypothetical protein, conserved [Eimeria tenella]CDJ42850.1 hypothetical protein, conserved [Eimeria tenella]|eukprot:XP_013233600.1 hypothetical protein, conserved [Eimeria tenella]
MGEDNEVFCLTDPAGEEDECVFVPAFLSHYFLEEDCTYTPNKQQKQQQQKQQQQQQQQRPQQQQQQHPEGAGTIEALEKSKLSKLDWSSGYTPPPSSQLKKKQQDPNRVVRELLLRERQQLLQLEGLVQDKAIQQQTEELALVLQLWDKVEANDAQLQEAERRLKELEAAIAANREKIKAGCTNWEEYTEQHEGLQAAVAVAESATSAAEEAPQEQQQQQQLQQQQLQQQQQQRPSHSLPPAANLLISPGTKQQSAFAQDGLPGCMQGTPQNRGPLGAPHGGPGASGGLRRTSSPILDALLSGKTLCGGSSTRLLQRMRRLKGAADAEGLGRVPANLRRRLQKAAAAAALRAAAAAALAVAVAPDGPAQPNASSRPKRHSDALNAQQQEPAAAAAAGTAVSADTAAAAHSKETPRDKECSETAEAGNRSPEKEPATAQGTETAAAEAAAAAAATEATKADAGPWRIVAKRRRRQRGSEIRRVLCAAAQTQPHTAAAEAAEAHEAAAAARAAQANEAAAAARAAEAAAARAAEAHEAAAASSGAAQAAETAAAKQRCSEACAVLEARAAAAAAKSENEGAFVHSSAALQELQRIDKRLQQLASQLDREASVASCCCSQDGPAATGAPEGAAPLGASGESDPRGTPSEGAPGLGGPPETLQACAGNSESLCSNKGPTVADKVAAGGPLGAPPSDSGAPGGYSNLSGEGCPSGAPKLPTTAARCSSNTSPRSSTRGPQGLLNRPRSLSSRGPQRPLSSRSLQGPLGPRGPLGRKAKAGAAALKRHTTKAEAVLLPEATGIRCSVQLQPQQQQEEQQQEPQKEQQHEPQKQQQQAEQPKENPQQQQNAKQRPQQQEQQPEKKQQQRQQQLRPKHQSLCAAAAAKRRTSVACMWGLKRGSVGPPARANRNSEAALKCVGASLSFCVQPKGLQAAKQGQALQKGLAAEQKQQQQQQQQQALQQQQAPSQEEKPQQSKQQQLQQEELQQQQQAPQRQRQPKQQPLQQQSRAHRSVLIPALQQQPRGPVGPHRTASVSVTFAIPAQSQAAKSKLLLPPRGPPQANSRGRGPKEGAPKEGAPKGGAPREGKPTGAAAGNSSTRIGSGVPVSGGWTAANGL